MVILIDSNQELNKILKLNKMETSIVFYMGKWCDACKSIKKTFLRLAAEYENKVQFLIVDVDLLEELVSKMNVNIIPTFHIFSKDGSLIDQLIGSNEEKLETLVEKISKQKKDGI